MYLSKHIDQYYLFFSKAYFFGRMQIKERKSRFLKKWDIDVLSIAKGKINDLCWECFKIFIFLGVSFSMFRILKRIKMLTYNEKYVEFIMVSRAKISNQ